MEDTVLIGGNRFIGSLIEQFTGAIHRGFFDRRLNIVQSYCTESILIKSNRFNGRNLM